MSETALQNKIRLAISSPNVRMFRNNVGQIGRVSFGLAVGSSDLIGFRTTTITPDMVGQQVAVFTALEVKTPVGKVSPQQQNFIDMVNRAGGIGAVVRSVDDATNLLF
ncbi:MAG: VRR-NUC domain-containing protein [Methylococcales bacterium]|nr:VRR-NUC domain-containing protein [Methylococcales bacterium]MDD5753973.1 VRR-NUC domain-containing protein [Methylococcales bacterium]